MSIFIASQMLSVVTFVSLIEVLFYMCDKSDTIANYRSHHQGRAKDAHRHTLAIEFSQIQSCLNPDRTH